MVSVFTFCVACYLVLLRPLFSGDNQPGGQDKIKREASALSNSGTGLWNWCMTQPSLKVVFKPFRILYKRVLEYVLFFVAGFLKNSGSEIIQVVISFMQVSGTFVSNYSIKVGQQLSRALDICLACVCLVHTHTHVWVDGWAWRISH